MWDCFPFTNDHLLSFKGNVQEHIVGLNEKLHKKTRGLHDSAPHECFQNNAFGD